MALFNLSCSAEIHETILEQGGVTAIITLLSSSANPEVIANCVKAMCNLSVGEESQGQIIERRGVPVVVEVAQRESTPLAVRFSGSLFVGEVAQRESMPLAVRWKKKSQEGFKK